MNFDGLIGNQKVKQQLIYLAESGRLPHAIVIEGEEGIGRRTLARELALNLFCLNRDIAPCRSCPQCSKVIKGLHPDIFEYTATGGARSFHIKTVREVIDDVYISPNEAEYKIYILGNCQCMSVQAQNALLKVLEEPPAYAVFILTVDNKASLLETVLSRSVVIRLEGVTPSEGAEYICSKNPELEYERALSALEVFGGNIGKAIESLTDGRLAEISSLTEELADALLHENEYELIKTCSAFSGDRELIVSVSEVFKTLCRDALFYGSSPSVSGFDVLAKRFSAALSKKSLCALIEKCELFKQLAQKNCNNNILITKIPYELRRAIGK